MTLAGVDFDSARVNQLVGLGILPVRNVVRAVAAQGSPRVRLTAVSAVGPVEQLEIEVAAARPVSGAGGSRRVRPEPGTRRVYPPHLGTARQDLAGFAGDCGGIVGVLSLVPTRRRWQPGRCGVEREPAREEGR